MRRRILITLVIAGTLSWAAQNAEAGLLRSLGKKIKGGSSQVAQSTVVPAAKETQAAGKATSNAVSTGVDKTKNGAETVAGAVGSAGSATADAVKTGAGATRDGAVAIAKGAQATPGVVAKGTESLGQKIWHVIW
jgi:hypothetical protein